MKDATAMIWILPLIWLGVTLAIAVVLIILVKRNTRRELQELPLDPAALGLTREDATECLVTAVRPLTHAVLGRTLLVTTNLPQSVGGPIRCFQHNDPALPESLKWALVRGGAAPAEHAAFDHELGIHVLRAPVKGYVYDGYPDIVVFSVPAPSASSISGQKSLIPA